MSGLSKSPSKQSLWCRVLQTSFQTEPLVSGLSKQAVTEGARPSPHVAQAVTQPRPPRSIQPGALRAASEHAACLFNPPRPPPMPAEPQATLAPAIQSSPGRLPVPGPPSHRPQKAITSRVRSSRRGGRPPRPPSRVTGGRRRRAGARSAPGGIREGDLGRRYRAPKTKTEQALL